MCPEYLLALACYLFPDGDTGDERRLVQFDAARELRVIARTMHTGGQGAGQGRQA